MPVPPWTWLCGRWSIYPEKALQRALVMAGHESCGRWDWTKPRKRSGSGGRRSSRWILEPPATKRRVEIGTLVCSSACSRCWHTPGSRGGRQRRYTHVRVDVCYDAVSFALLLARLYYFGVDALPRADCLRPTRSELRWSYDRWTGAHRGPRLP
ncbi:hypothetical protein BDY17DRAFT_184856 [Neohortaea acidophila]|uniref:Uncharacterized protein n=1 Tax=Neohortaea acidophila TaxID=245834 RepID=A0A6A6PN22_9PEZI|nr:uncharacterized protein BDY17DRAFT_184856 [Neohortaea acidophila]KAF2481226.1 hypothetical protein BDY17DRAFT_184856 [Neohortaea acidophila]